MANRRLLLLALLLAACSTPVEETPVEPVRLVVTPEAAHLVGAMTQGIRADIQTAPLDEAVAAVESGEADLLITFALPPEGWFATPLALDGFAVITHDDVAVQAVSMEELEALYSGTTANWDALGGGEESVQVFAPFPGDALRLWLEEVRGWSNPAPTAVLVPSPQAAIEAVAETPGGIIIVPYSALADGADVLRVDGIRPGSSTFENGRYPLTVEVLAMAPTEPEGHVRAWLVDLQTVPATETPVPVEE